MTRSKDLVVFPLHFMFVLLPQHRWLDGVRTLRAPAFVLGFCLKNGSCCFVPRHTRELSKNLFGRRFNVFEEQSSSCVIQRLVAELARLSSVLTLPTCQVRNIVRKYFKSYLPVSHLYGRTCRGNLCAGRDTCLSWRTGRSDRTYRAPTPGAVRRYGRTYSPGRPSDISPA